MDNIKVYVEIGEKRAIAVAIDWPGWCRGERSETAALQALADYTPRYAQVLHMAQVDFPVPADNQALVVVERLKGNKTTDYGVPNLVAEADRGQIDRAEFERLRGVLQACWLTLDGAARAAAGKELRKGPRGG
jgi:hypothetical protein